LKENELELVVVCTGCRKEFRKFSELLVFHIPEQLIKELKIHQRPHLKCPYCRNNKFIIKVLKDKYGEYK
jgi:hypothetical protein